MLETPHVAVGAAIATKIPNPWIALPLAFASHFVLEKIPHWNPHINTELKKNGKLSSNSKAVIATDVVLALFTGFTIANQALPNTAHFWTIIFASFFAVLPDLIEGPYFFLGVKNKFLNAWVKFQKSLQADTDILPGLATQLATFVAAIAWVFN